VESIVNLNRDLSEAIQRVGHAFDVLLRDLLKAFKRFMRAVKKAPRPNLFYPVGDLGPVVKNDAVLRPVPGHPGLFKGKIDTDEFPTVRTVTIQMHSVDD
jgi:hypothetical protein